MTMTMKMTMAMISGLRGLSLSSNSCSFPLRCSSSWKTKPPTASCRAALDAATIGTTRTLKHLFLPRNHIIVRGLSSSDLNPAETETERERETNGDVPIAVPMDQIKNAVDLLDIRVGRIIKAWRHEEADSLYVEEVDIGESQPRIICSGLVKYIPIHLLQDAKVVVLANLKPRNMRGIKSYGMLMAASDVSHQNVELLVPPDSSVPGDRIWFGSENDESNQPDPATPNQVQKKKIWELVQPHLKTDDSCRAMIGDGEYIMRTSAGVVVSRSLRNANIS